MIWTTDITVRCGKSNEVGQMTTDKIRKFKEIRRLITRELRVFGVAALSYTKPRIFLAITLVESEMPLAEIEERVPGL